MQKMSPLQKRRLTYIPEIPTILEDLASATFQEDGQKKINEEIKPLFPHLLSNSHLTLIKGKGVPKAALRVGVVLSGGQAAGGHNVITGLFDALKELHRDSVLIGFLNGPKGIIKGDYKIIESNELNLYRNQGGFDLLGSGRDKIESPDDFRASLEVVKKLQLDGLVVVGGDDSNTNAAHLAEYFLANEVKTRVIGVPKTIDGDLQSKDIEISFGFDTACRVYAETIGNIAKDALSQKKYYYFIKLMGRSASHITLECALLTQPNLALIGEEIYSKKMTLSQVASSIADLIIERSGIQKEYGVIILPEGLIEFLIDVRALIAELNLLASTTGLSKENLQLSESSRACFALLPPLIQDQLLQDRDPHGNVQVSKIETERLLIYAVQKELKSRQEKGEYQGSFSAQPIFCGYEGRSALPTNFDATYCYSLGRVASLLIAHNKTGYMASLRGLKGAVKTWQAKGVSLIEMMALEVRKGKKKPVIQKTLVSLEGKAFLEYSKQRDQDRLEDLYVQPGPIQFFLPESQADFAPRIVLEV
jgi:diphosphate-dependent phosphofructokinase